MASLRLAVVAIKQSARLKFVVFVVLKNLRLLTFVYAGHILKE